MRPSAFRPSRRELFQAGALTSAAASSLAAAPAPARADDANVYTRIGVRPFINLTATYTINGGTLTLPEVKAAMDEASRFSVSIDELMDKAGQRIAELFGAESAMVTSGCAGALAHATAACVAGADPENIAQLPNLDGLKSEVIMPAQSRNEYDHAIRSVGVKIINVETPEEFHAALGPRTAMVALLAKGESEGKIRLEEMAEAAHKLGVPLLVDAAAELPGRRDPCLSRGADLVAYSGGKILRGPQCAGLLMGRKDLIVAARANSSPHHSFGRAMKVGKEEISGMLAAVEAWALKRDLQSEYRTWTSWMTSISEEITRVPGVTTKMLPPAGGGPFPTMQVDWDPARVGITAGELGRLLLDGEPRIMSHAEGEGHSFVIRPAAMKPEHYQPVAKRLYEVLSQAPKGGAPKLAAPASDLSGDWTVNVQYATGSAQHHLTLKADGNRLTGTHHGRKLAGNLHGVIDGARVRFRSSMPYEGAPVTYSFTGAVEGNRMSGEVGLGEFGSARWTANRT
ncbi:MAG TPA: aminotransferase class V-fold PLP-dependent enzyme [Bryobacteraceae bacterium]|nr:aminotransferase class V-fold PLP-dependent enzyme [Bryobacteraceae bacterium]